jgi:hypothetical protein
MGGVVPDELAAGADTGLSKEGQFAANAGQLDITTSEGLAQAERAGAQKRLTEGALGKLETPEGTAAGLEAMGSPEALRSAGQANLEARKRDIKALAVAPTGAADRAKVLDELFGDIYRAYQIGNRLKDSVLKYNPGFLNQPINKVLKYANLQPRDAKLFDEYLQMLGKAFSEERLQKAGATLTATELAEIRSWAPRPDDNLSIAYPNLERGTGWLVQRLDRDAAELSQFGRTEQIIPQLMPMYWKFGRTQPATKEPAGASRR